MRWVAVVAAFQIAKVFETQVGAERWARAFDVARRFNGFLPLTVKPNDDGTWGIWRDDAKRKGM